MVQHTLYGSPMSLYTGRARSYLIKSGVAFREEPLVSAHFYEQVLPRAGGRRSMPTLEFADGSVIRDSVAIVDHFEAANAYPFTPTTPCQQIVSLLLDVIGAEGMLRPAMHYRWNQNEDNTRFVEFHFYQLFEDQQTARDRMQHLRTTANPHMGIVPQTYALIERLYAQLLTRLETHFSAYPYFLGTKPCIGDFGMIAPLYGHLGRDPVPLALMQKQAVRAWRWVERMNRPEPDMGEFGLPAEAYLSDDKIPDTLVAVLRELAVDFVPETIAAAQVTNTYLAEHPDLEGTPVERAVGMGSFTVDGDTISSMAQPFRFYLLARVQDTFAGLSAADQENVRALLRACDMDRLLDCTITRRIGRANNLEIWL
ncbi:MAG: glutathione S-transferase N-terminal domain-containing protein [Pseudomonadota bacterium]